MSHFKDIVYTRPNPDQLHVDYQIFIDQFKDAQSVEEQMDVLEKENQFWRDLLTSRSLASVRHALDLNNTFYKEENQFFDQFFPKFNNLANQLDVLCVKTKNRPILEKEFSKKRFTQAEINVQLQHPAIVEPSVRINELINEYMVFMGQVTLELDGETISFRGLFPKMKDPDRATRKKVFEVYGKFFEEHSSKIDPLFDELVQLRHQIAQQLGFDNYIKRGYLATRKSEYGVKEVNFFLAEVEKHFPPLAQEIFQAKQERIGLDTIYHHDSYINFASGNPKPIGDLNTILENTRTFYKELSPETEKLFDASLEGGWLDLENRSGKGNGGFAAFFHNFNQTFVFGNFNGSSSDILLLTHEIGHAFQKYMSREVGNKHVGNYSPGPDIAEIASTAMELFSLPKAELFFGEDADKFRYTKFNELIFSIVSSCIGEEFQQKIYQNPKMTSSERNAAYATSRKRFRPITASLDFYDGNQSIFNGHSWKAIAHFFFQPFYYIDYALANICALQMYQKMQKDPEAAWQDYLNLCKAGGSMGYFETLKHANLKSPFEPGVVAEAANFIKEQMNGIDVSRF